uniref:Multidrug and toxin extrusion protein n=1 Tax=Cyprinus carpio TaxID=7962 RepID=A0A8C1U5T9_CYPCA
MEASSPRTDAVSMEPSAKLFCCGFMRRCIPLVFREELYHILRMTGPLLVCRFLNFLLFFVVTMFCGRLGNTVLAGYAMASATINVTAAATGLGLALACDTLVSQTFGSKNLLRVGVILQRGILILTLFSLPCWALLVNTQPLLLYLGQEPEVARIAQLYVVAYLPAIPAMFLYQLQLSYLQNQGVIMPQMYASAVANVANVIVNYFLLYWWDFGVYGSAAANTFAQVFNCFALFCFIRWQRLHEKTWGGWSSEALQEWGSYMKLAIPSTLMTCFEWWIYEVGGFLAGMLSEVDLAAQHVVIMLAYINYMIPLGMQGAACVRVGNALGAGETAAAILTSKVSLISAAIFQGFVLGSTKTVIVFFFFQCVGMGILLGTGQQKIAAIANLFGYYCIGLPSSIVLMFTAKLQVAGFWLGLFIAVFLLAIFFTVAIFKLNWKKLTEEVGISGLLKQHLSSNYTPHDHVLTYRKECKWSSKWSSEPEPSQQLLPGGAQCRGIFSVFVVFILNNQQELEETPTVLLSTAQLILRRGLTTLAALLILAVGIAIHLTVPLPEVSYSAGANFTLDSNFTTTTFIYLM